MTANIPSLQYIRLVPLCGRKTLPARNVLEGSWRASGLAHIGSLTPWVYVEVSIGYKMSKTPPRWSTEFMVST